MYVCILKELFKSRRRATLLRALHAFRDVARDFTIVSVIYCSFVFWDWFEGGKYWKKDVSFESKGFIEDNISVRIIFMLFVDKIV